jgi:hypothetical protein
MTTSTDIPFERDSDLPPSPGADSDLSAFGLEREEPASESPPSSKPRSQPPPLPADATPPPPPERVAADAAFAERMLECLARSDYAGALFAAEALLETHPGHQDLLDSAQIARSELRRLYVARLGSVDRAPRLAMGPQGLLSLQSLDFHAGFLLSRVDGRATVSEIVEASGLPAHEALRILSELYLRRAISFAE